MAGTRIRLSPEEVELINESRGKDLQNINGNTALDIHLKDRGINKKDIVSVKHWQSMSGELRFSIVTKEQLINQIATTTWGYGDVVAYWCNNGPTDGSHVKYGHTQIYVGEINSIGWSTSKALNYKTDFPYRKRKGDNWTYLVFRAPSS